MDNPTDKPDTDKESSAGLSDLVHEELEAKPAEPAAPSLPADLPAFGQDPKSEAPRDPEWEPPPMTVTFWQKMAPKRGIRAIHVIVGSLLVAIAGAGVAAVLVLRQPPQAEGSAPIAAATTAAPVGSTAQPAATPTPAATTPAPAVSPSAEKDAGASPSARTAKPKARAREPRRKAPSNEKSEESRDEPAEAPAAPAPAEPAAAGDALTADDIKLGVKQNMAKVKGCIKSARQAGELAAGRHTLILDWTIAPSGAVTEAHVRGPANLVETSLAKCFSSAMRRWKFRPSPKGAPVKNFPFGPFAIK